MNNTDKARFYGVKEVCKFFNCSETKSYKIIKQLNKELEDLGYLTFAGRVPVGYFNKRYYSE